MPSKRRILDAISRQVLLEVAQTFEITGLTGKTKDQVVDALASSHRATAPAVLELLKRDELKGICRKLDLDDGGRQKQELIDRLLGRDGAGNDHQINAKRGAAMAKRQGKKGGNGAELFNVEDYRHESAKRKNNPPAKIAAEGTVPVMPKIEYSYSPRRPPELQFDPTGQPDRLPDLLADATARPLTKDEAYTIAEALRNQEPWLEWAGKREQEVGGFEVDPVALHIHERVSAQAILRVAARKDIERTLFGDPEQAYQEAVQFYRYDIDWTNRLILGDSLQVMASLARREDLAGKVQMIYIDPPYGIKFASNFQPEVGRRDVKEKESDLTREPEMVKAYRDTWHLGIHSYLSYLRDRILVARELLADTGSIFVQISDENIHRVRQILDDTYGPDCHIATISFVTTGGQTTEHLPRTTDHVLWYCKHPELMKARTVYAQRGTAESLPSTLSWYIRDPFGSWRRVKASELSDAKRLEAEGKPYWLADLLSRSGGASAQFSVEVDGRSTVPHRGGWRTSEDGMVRLRRAERLQWKNKVLLFRRFKDDFWLSNLSTLWTDTQSGGFRGSDKVYVVQTPAKVIERCLLMTTDPGDLVLDPTCGSGTTAHVAETWGRRWITIDTSRVAVAIARQRLLTSRFDRYRVKGEDEYGNRNGTHDVEVDPNPGFIYDTIPQITLKSIAKNTNLDPILSRYEKILDDELATCNAALRQVDEHLRQSLEYKLVEKEKREGTKSIIDADRRRWQLPKKGVSWQHWDVPFDADSDWPKELRNAVTKYRAAWQAKMAEVDECVAANAEHEELVDKPQEINGVVRVSGPFTVEAVQPPELSLGQVVGEVSGKFDGEPDALEGTFQIRPVEPRAEFEVKNVEAYLDEMTRLLRVDGVRFPNNKQNNFSRLERIVGTEGAIHAEGRWAPAGQKDDDPEGRGTVAVAFGPQYGPVTAKQVEDLIRGANRRGYDDLVIAGFSFDGAAQAVIEEARHPKLRVHMAHIRPDVNPGMAGLLKEKPGSQLFSVFGQPRTRVKGPNGRGEYTVEMQGVDIYDPLTGSISSTETEKVAAWFLDGDYDDRTFCITQAFFPDQAAWEKLARALGGRNGVIDDSAFEALSGTQSLPFPPGKHKCVAVKVIDPRGNEVMQVHRL